MMFKTHLAFGLFAGLLSLKFLEAKNIIIFLSLASFFAVFPDIDEKSSKIGKRLKFLSFPIGIIFGHRGMFHTVYLPITIFLLFLMFDNPIYGIAAFIGYFSHLLTDSLTVHGIRPFYPLLNWKIRSFIKTNSILEFLLFLLIVAIDFYGILTYI